MYSLEFKEKVVRDFNKIPQKEKTKLWERILRLKNEPRPSGTRKLIGKDNLFRLRCGNYRIIYEVKDKFQIVTIIQVGHRKEIYR